MVKEIASCQMTGDDKDLISSFLADIEIECPECHKRYLLELTREHYTELYARIDTIVKDAHAIARKKK